MLKPLKFVYSIWTVVSFLLLTIPMMIGYLLLKLIPYQKQINGVYVINRTAIFIWSIMVGMRYHPSARFRPAFYVNVLAGGQKQQGSTQCQ